MVMLHRRSVLSGLIAAFAAPAIVRYQSIMPIKLMSIDTALGLNERQPVVWESGPWRIGEDGLVDCTYLPPDGYIDPDWAANPVKFYRKVGATVDYDKKIVEQSASLMRWYNDPPYPEAWKKQDATPGLIKGINVRST